MPFSPILANVPASARASARFGGARTRVQARKVDGAAMGRARTELGPVLDSIKRLTPGRIVYVGANGRAAETDNLHWDNDNTRLGIGTTNPSAALHIATPVGTGDSWGMIMDLASGATVPDVDGLRVITNNPANRIIASFEAGGNQDMGGIVQLLADVGGFDFHGRAGIMIQPGSNVPERLWITTGAGVGGSNPTTSAWYISSKTNGGTLRPIAFNFDSAEPAVIIETDKRVGIDAESPATSAKLEIGGTDGAVLFPRLTTTQRDNLTAAAGMVIYNTSTNTLQFYNGTTWGNV